MNLSTKITADGSATVFSDVFQETYHSVNGAVAESMHVFINAGLNAISERSIEIFEVGFGTGLNALLTFQEAKSRAISINYHSIELFPIDDCILNELVNSNIISENTAIFNAMHKAVWNSTVEIDSFFKLLKIKENLLNFKPQNEYNLIYFDAFSPVHQPELWTLAVFEKFYKCMKPGGILTTYCAKGEVRRNLQTAGFKVERLPGPPGKREMLRASKPY